MTALTVRPAVARTSTRKPPTVRMYSTATVWLVAAAMVAAVAVTALVGWWVTR